MHVLITGADGFVGKHLVRKFLREGHSITTFTRSIRHPNSQKIQAIQCDLLDVQSWETAFDKIEKIDAVIHLAAIMPDASNVTAEDFNLGNRQFTKYLCNKVADISSPAQGTFIPFIYFSSVGVIGEPNQNIIDESYIPSQEDISNLHPYFVSKLGGECEIKEQSESCLSRFIFRLTSPYGALMPQKGVLPYFTKQARAGNNISWHGSGARTQDFIYVDDIADICMKSVLSGQKQYVEHSLYLASGERTTMQDLAVLIADKAGVNAGTSGQDDVQEDKIWSINNQALKETFGISEMTSLDSGLDCYMKSLDEPGENIDLIWWGDGA